jgi:hypothetical protein
MMAGVPAEAGTEYLPDTSAEHYRYANLLACLSSLTVSSMSDVPSRHFLF